MVGSLVNGARTANCGHGLAGATLTGAQPELSRTAR
jgi:hypothetical protein